MQKVIINLMISSGNPLLLSDLTKALILRRPNGSDIIASMDMPFSISLGKYINRNCGSTTSGLCVISFIAVRL